jgi:hypothetical protein
MRTPLSRGHRHFYFAQRPGTHRLHRRSENKLSILGNFLLHHDFVDSLCIFFLVCGLNLR